MNRWKNYGLWVSLASLVLLILQMAGIDIAPTNYHTVVNAILSFLVAAGVISNPTTQNAGYFDDKNSQN